jgi:hypothetical protein
MEAENVEAEQMEKQDVNVNQDEDEDGPDSEYEVDPIFQRYAYDYDANKYMQKDTRIYPKDKARIGLIEKIKTKLEGEKERDEDGVPLTNINVELSKRNRITKRRPLDPLVYKEVKKEEENSKFEFEPLVKSSDAKRTNNRKIAEKEFINKQKEKYAQRIGYLPDYEAPLPLKNKGSDMNRVMTEEEACAINADKTDDMNQSLKQTLIGPEVYENGDTTVEQMEWELESKLTDLEIDTLGKLKKRIIVYINNTIRMDDNYLLCKAIQLVTKYEKGNYEIIPIY